MFSCGGHHFLPLPFVLVTLSLIVSSVDLFSLSATEFIRSRRNRHATNESLVTNVSPTEVTMADGSEVEVECKASWKGRIVPDDIANVNFNWWIASDTVLPLSALLPGVTIRTVSDDYTEDDSPLRSESVRVLTIDPSMYRLLPRGLSRFSCSAQSHRHGHSEPAFFYVIKV